MTFAPATIPTTLSEEQGRQRQSELRFVTGSSDNKIRDWISRGGDIIEHEVGIHNDLIRDVAWAPNIGFKHDVLASASESADESVKLWRLNGEKWECF